jgi:hypothetical protein
VLRKGRHFLLHQFTIVCYFTLYFLYFTVDVQHRLVQIQIYDYFDVELYNTKLFETIYVYVTIAIFDLPGNVYVWHIKSNITQTHNRDVFSMTVLIFAHILDVNTSALHKRTKMI